MTMPTATISTTPAVRRGQLAGQRSGLGRLALTQAFVGLQAAAFVAHHAWAAGWVG